MKKGKTLKAVIFDFDGIIVSTKTAEYESWRRVFLAHDCSLNIRKWIKIIDNIKGEYDPALYLFSECLYRYHRKINRTTARTLQKNLYESLASHLKPLPGVLGTIKKLKNDKYKIGIASNGMHQRISDNLKQLKLLDYFDSVVCKEDVKNKKPSPDVYLKSIETLQVKNDEAIVFEDSPAGILAAKTANIYCICVPNKITNHLDLSGADRTIKSLKGFSIDDLTKSFGDSQRVHLVSNV